MPWTEEQSTLLVAILDQLIPANQERNILAAGGAGTVDYIREQVRRDTDLDASISTLLDRVAELAGAGITPNAARQLESELPDEFNKLVVTTYMGYYSRSDIRALLGVGAHPVHPKGYEVVREAPELMVELTAPVRARGPVFRDPTGDRT